MKTSKKITIHEHKLIGSELNRICQDLRILSCSITNKYGKTSAFAKDATRTHNAAEELRSELEEQMFVDCPIAAHTGIYYGPRHLSKI